MAKTFESQLKRLEEISNKMEDGAVSLNQTVKLYEEGWVLIESLQQELESAEKKVQMLMNRENGKTEDFMPEEE